MTLYPGTKAFAILTINSAFVAETNPHFLCQVNASSLLLNAKFKSFISSRANILVWDLQNLVVRPSRMVLNLAGNELFIYFDGAVSSTVSLQYAICVSPLFVETDSASAFTNCGVNYAIALNETSGSTVGDYADGGSGTMIGVNLGANGKFGKSAEFTAATSYVNMGTSLSIHNKTKLSVEIIVKVTNRSVTNLLYTQYGGGAATRSLMSISSGENVLWAISNGMSSYGSWAFGSDIQNNTWVHIVGVYDGSQTGNADRMKLWVNGVQKTLTFTGTIPATTPNIPATPVYLGNPSNSLVGNLDEFMISTTTSIPAVSRYNMLFNPSAFSTLGPAKTAGGRRNINIGIMESVNLF